MLIFAICIFLVAVILGLTILVAILEDRPTRKPIVLLHGSAAGIGILCMIIYRFIAGSSPLLNISLTLFILAALGGLTLAAIDMKKKKVPKLLALIHPVVAVAGLIALIMYVLP